MTKKTYLYFLLLSLLAITLLLQCDKDDPTEPIEPEPVEYRVYVLDGLYGRLATVDVATDSVIDSVQLGYNADHLFLTPDGERLLVRKNSGSPPEVSIDIYNTSDLSFIETTDKKGYYHFDAGNNYGVYLEYGVYFVDPVDLSITDTVNLGEFSASHLSAYLDTMTDLFFVGAGKADSGYILKIDCNKKSLVDSFQITVPIMGNMAYNRINNCLYFHSGYTDPIGYFYKYDINSRQLVSQTMTHYWFGGVAVSPDGSLVYMTGSGNSWWGGPSVRNVLIFNTLQNHPIDSILPPPRDSIPFGWNIGNIVLTPDGKKAYIGAAWGNGLGTLLFAADLNNNVISKIITPYHTASSIAIGKVPK